MTYTTPRPPPRLLENGIPIKHQASRILPIPATSPFSPPGDHPHLAMASAVSGALAAAAASVAVSVAALGVAAEAYAGGEACLCRRPPPRAVSSACVTHGRVMTRIGDLARGMWPGPPSMTGGRQRRLVARLLCPHWRGKQAWA